jgi:hypothetical protein
MFFPLSCKGSPRRAANYESVRLANREKIAAFITRLAYPGTVFAPPDLSNPPFVFIIRLATTSITPLAGKLKSASA